MRPCQRWGFTAHLDWESDRKAVTDGKVLADTGDGAGDGQQAANQPGYPGVIWLLSTIFEAFRPESLPISRECD